MSVGFCFCCLESWTVWTDQQSYGTITPFSVAYLDTTPYVLPLYKDCCCVPLETMPATDNKRALS